MSNGEQRSARISTFARVHRATSTAYRESDPSTIMTTSRARLIAILITLGRGIGTDVCRLEIPRASLSPQMLREHSSRIDRVISREPLGSNDTLSASFHRKRNAPRTHHQQRTTAARA